MEDAARDEQPIVAKRVPLFSIVAGAMLFLCLFTPFLLLTLPVMATVGLAIVGAFRREKPTWLPYVIGALAVALIIMSNSHVSHGGFGNSAGTTNSELYKDATWEYGSSKDQMRGTMIQWATLNSPTDLELSPPYDGENTARIETGTGGDLILTVTKGQFVCHSDDTVSLKFDDGPVFTYPCQQASNGNSNTLYINTAYSPEPGQPLTPVDGILKSKKMVVEAEFYQDGARQIIFNVSGLDKSKA